MYSFKTKFNSYLVGDTFKVDSKGSELVCEQMFY